MVLSDRTIAALLAEGRIGIDPYDASLLQPSSVDVRVDRFFRVFRNSRYPYIDVKEPQEELTELVEVSDEPFILHPGEFVLGSTLERVTLPDDLVARLEGKALALDTPVPTPSGWTTMGDLEPGDIVFSELGEPTVVVAGTPPLAGRPCVEMVFSEGTTVVCDESHQWATVDKNGSCHVKTAAEIARTLYVHGEPNHSVALTDPVRYPDRDLPVDPYEVGVRAIQRAKTAQSVPGATARGALALELEAVPDEYLEASVDQRTALLEGVMDTNGDVDDLGRCFVTTIHEPLALQFQELVASLGFRPTIARKRAELYGMDCGPRFEIQFTADRPVFRLPRKLARQKLTGRFHRFRAIADVRPIESVPVRCIQVSAPSGQFLVTRSYVPTHNSSLGRLGLLIHSTAGFIDPGWDGHVTLELSNVANLPITIYHEMKIGQLSFMQLTEPSETPYGSASLGSKYQGQRGPTPSRYWQNFR